MTTDSIQAEIDHLSKLRQEKLQELFTIDGSLQAFLHMLEQLRAVDPPSES